MKSKSRERLRIRIGGVVQGVGFRPFVYRLAWELQLGGWVKNSSAEVEVEVEGLPESIQRFLVRLRSEAPPNALVRAVDVSSMVLLGDRVFAICPSELDMGRPNTEILPDIATCEACLEEMLDPQDRRYQYPFINCIHCGPRYSIIQEVPYDRCHTTMQAFTMCQACQVEYKDPTNRRFHAQPNACWDCGPQLDYQGADGLSQGMCSAALNLAAGAISEGKIVAVKGLGGFHLFADASREATVRALRKRKRRESKPFALMYPSLNDVLEDCHVSEREADLLGSPAAPIVLLRRRATSKVPPEVAPENPYLGAMLPYAPLHHLLMRLLERPLVATSGNLTEEPICIDNDEAKRRLRNVADGFLMHNRSIQRAVDDSVVCVVADREMMLRRSRGYAPLAIEINPECPAVIAMGGDLKNTIALTNHGQAFVSQYFGNLSNACAQDAFCCHREDFPRLFRAKPKAVAIDLHPDYYSSRLGAKTSLPVIRVQHHHAHLVACLVDNGLDEEVLGVVWDGTGYGPDGTIWGGEFLLGTMAKYERINYLRAFPLPGGEKAVREPRLVALGLLHEAGMMPSEKLRAAFSHRELGLVQAMLGKKLNSPRTSSVGRLFDAVAALIGICVRNQHEGQAAMQLEYALPETVLEDGYTCPSGKPLDWEPMIRELLTDLKLGLEQAIVSSRFHNTMVALIVAIAQEVGRHRVALTGGCFQNRYLLERSIVELRAVGFEPIWHRQVPPNDGGLALGQACVVASQLQTV